MMEAWLKASETIRSGSVATTGITPVLQLKPDWNVRAASTCLKRASSASSSSRSAIVPEIVRTAPDPAPKRRSASRDASTSRGCVFRPRYLLEASVIASRPSTVTRVRFALLITWSGRYRPCARTCARSSARCSSGSRVGVVLTVESSRRPRAASRGPVQDHLAGVAGAGGRERGGVLAEREPVSDRGRDVEPGLEHHRHLVPGLVHLPAVDAAERQHLEHDLVDIQRDLRGGDPEDRDAPAVGHAGDRGAERGGVAGHLQGDVESLRHPQPRRDVAEVALARGTGFGSETTTWRAPAWRTTAAAIRPMGPAPEMSTSSPSTGNASAVWTAFPNGSKIAATSSSIPRQWCQTFVIGRTTSSANAPSRPTPRPIVWAQRWRRPARQCRQRPQTTWPSPLTRSPGAKPVTLEPTSTTSPTNS